MNVKSDRWFRAVCAIPYQSEKLDTNVIADSYVDMGHLSRINNNTAQYIDGRRGTGKTHLLMYLADHVNLTVDTDRKIGAYVDARTLRAESDVDGGEPKALAKMLFRELVISIAKELERINSRFLWNNEIPTARSEYDRRTMRRSAAALVAIYKAINIGEAVPVGQSKRQEKSSTVAGAKITKTAKFSLKLSSKPEMTADGGLGVDETQANEQSVSEERNAAYRISYSSVRHSVEQFLEANDLELLIVCIDEWSSIPMQAQPHFADLIKRTFFPGQKCAIKIGTLPFQTNFSVTANGQVLGFERNGDIYCGIDLDDDLLLARNPDRSKALITSLLFQHIRAAFERTAADGEAILDLKDPSALVSALFNDKAYGRLMQFAQGNARDFLTLFKKCYMRFYQETAARISVGIVDEVTMEFGKERLLAIRENERAYTVLTKIIDRIVHRLHKHTFLVPSANAGDRALLHLIHNRALHIWDRSYSSASDAGKRFLLLIVDYCIIVEHLKSPNYRPIIFELPFTDEAARKWREAKEDLARGEIAASNDSPDIAVRPDKRSARHTVLDEDVLKADYMTRCAACFDEYDNSHPVVKKARVCPLCAAPIPASA